MTAQDILAIVDAFFKAILKVLEALGFVKGDTATDETVTEEA